jgi:hypothetical protein
VPMVFRASLLERCATIVDFGMLLSTCHILVGIEDEFPNTEIFDLHFLKICKDFLQSRRTIFFLIFQKFSYLSC